MEQIETRFLVPFIDGLDEYHCITCMTREEAEELKEELLRDGHIVFAISVKSITI